MMQLAVDARNQLGECALWCERTERLLWTDIPASTLWAHTPALDTTCSWPLPERLASFALTPDDDRLLLGLASGLAFFTLSTGEIERICDVEPTLAGTRINDGRCDRQGRFVFGMFNQDSEPREAVGSFYRLNRDLTLERLPLGKVAIANSICFSPDGATMYYCDSQAAVIRSCDYGDDIGEQRVFADLSGEQGAPDGSTVDAEGYLWNARWGAGRLVRYSPDGNAERVIMLAASQPTCLAFGGPLLDTVYATSARQWLSSAEVANAPKSGGVFRFATDVVGLAEPRFQG